MGSADGTGNLAAFYQVRQLGMDASGNVYAPDRWTFPAANRVRKISPEGVVTTLAGGLNAGSTNGVGTAASFRAPTGVVVDSSGNVFVAEMGNHRIRKITPAGVVTTFAGSNRGNLDGTGTNALFDSPAALAIDGNDNLYVSDAYNYNIRKITPAAVVTTLAGSSAAGHANGVGPAASFDFVTALVVDAAGNIYAADSNNHSIRKIAPDGTVTTFAGSTTPGATNGQGTLATFNFPQGLTRDAQGNLFVADTGNHLIRLITPAGQVSTIAGTGAAGQSDGVGTLASFDSPWGLIVNAQGTIYVSDTNNFTIRKLVPN